MDPLRFCKNCEDPYDPRNYDRDACTRSGRICSRWSHDTIGAGPGVAEGYAAFLYLARYNQQDYDLRSCEIPVHNICGSRLEQAREALVGLESIGKPSLCLYALCNLPSASTAKPLDRWSPCWRATVPRLVFPLYQLSCFSFDDRAVGRLLKRKSQAEDP